MFTRFISTSILLLCLLSPSLNQVIELDRNTSNVICSQRYQCHDVFNLSTHYNFIDCINGKCTCLSNQGFSGNASINNKCTCNTSIYTVYYQQPNKPYCISLIDGVTYKNNKQKHSHMRSVVEEIYKYLVWPKPAILVAALKANQSIPVLDLFESDATGRVDPLGSGFNTGVSLFEYFYGTVFGPTSRVASINIQRLIAQDDLVYINVHILIDNYDPFTGLYVFSENLTESGSFRFNPNGSGKIKSVDLIIHNLGSKPSSLLPPGDLNLVQSICFILINMSHCNSTYDPTGYYTSIEDCVNHMLNVYQWGTWDDLVVRGNSTICRVFHTLLSEVRPDVHCSHAGKTGGGKCIPHVYSDYFGVTF